MTKGRNIYNFVNSQPLVDVRTPAVSLDVSDRFTGWRFEVSLSNVSLFFLSSQNLARLSSVFIFYKLSSVDRLAFRYIQSP